MKKDQKITVREYVHTAQGVVPVEELTAEQKRKLDRWIVETWVNTLYAGRAEVFFPEDEKGGSAHTAGGRPADCRRYRRDGAGGEVTPPPP